MYRLFKLAGLIHLFEHRLHFEPGDDDDNYWSYFPSIDCMRRSVICLAVAEEDAWWIDKTRAAGVN